MGIFLSILDRQRFWAFIKAYLICFTALVGLYVVIDAFSNLDEFSEVADGSMHLFANMGRYYLIRLSLFYDRLCGVISMMAAIFTVTWMQKNNEMVAMLAAGIGTRRIIRPVWISAILVSAVAVVNQELILTRFGEELQKTPDDDGSIKKKVYSREDVHRVMIDGKEADRVSRTIVFFSATFPVELTGSLTWVEAKQARYIPENDPDAPLKGGWLLRGAQMKPADAKADPKILIKLNDLKGFPPALGELQDLGLDAYFLRTGLSFASVTKKPGEWYQFATTPELILALSDPANDPEKVDIAVFLHNRLIRPLLSLTLMFLSLPLVLGGMGRNMFVNLGMSLGTSGLFYAACFLAQYLGGHNVLTPEMTAWGPLMVFGTIAVARWDTIRT